MIGEREIWACAIEVIRQHGEDAAIHAARRADALLAEGEHEGGATWARIVARINALSAGARTTVH